MCLTRISAFVVLSFLTGCSATLGSRPGPTPASSAPAAPREPLPHAENVLDMIEAPVVALEGSRLTVDGAPAGDVSEVVAANQLRRIDLLWETLKEKRAAWKKAHPQAASPGVVILRIAPNVKAVVVKSVFQTAAFAGYPNASFMVQSWEGSRVGRLVADAQVPGPPRDEPEPPEKVLVVEVVSDKFVLVWKEGATVLSTVDVPRSFPELAAKIGLEWKANGQHRDASDKRWDRAIVVVPNDADHAVIVGAIDAVYAAKRTLVVNGKPEEVPAFNATFAMGARGSASAVTGGRLAPEKIQAVVRASFGKLRGCYEKGLAKNATLKGRVTVQFVIEQDGSVTRAEEKSSADAIPDVNVASCIVAEVTKLKFPKPDGGHVTVVYPFVFNVGD